jgi:peptidoglycan/LPS O-acetylase OafA/YrhL
MERAGRLSWAGVDLFFVLSGFLIGGILMRNRDSPDLLRVFYARRVLRIFPVYFAWLAAFYALRALCGGHLRSAWLFGFPLPGWSYLTFTQNFVMAAHRFWGAHWLAPTWSLAVEEQFYLILPLLVLVLRPRALAALSLLLVLSAPFIRHSLLLRGNEVGALVLLQTTWDLLFIGVIGAYLFQPGTPAVLRPSRRLLLHGALLASVALCAACIALPRLINLWLASLLPTFVGLLSLALIGFAIYSPWRSLLAGRWLVGLGRISYGIYIFHEGIYGLLYAAAHRGQAGTGEPMTLSWLDVDTVVLSLGITVALAMLSFRYFESPLIELGKRLHYAREAPPAAPGPPECTVPRQR